jgi:uncharacterized protein YndB with AHSA1/START domain
MPIDPIRRTVTVRGDPERAFELFTAGMGTWWPVDEYSRAVSELAADNVRVTHLEFQARQGGSILEHLSDGRNLPWGEVTGWNPPQRVVMAWKPHSLPEPPTEVEVMFEPLADETAVQLEHRGWERLSDGLREGLYEIYARGWGPTLERFAATANRMAS